MYDQFPDAAARAELAKLGDRHVVVCQADLYGRTRATLDELGKQNVPVLVRDTCPAGELLLIDQGRIDDYLRRPLDMSRLAGEDARLTRVREASLLLYWIRLLNRPEPPTTLRYTGA